MSVGAAFTGTRHRPLRHRKRRPRRRRPFDRELFTSGRPGFITRDEESSGIIAAEQQLGNGWFRFDAQVHAPAASPEYVEKGQLLAVEVDSFERI